MGLCYSIHCAAWVTTVGCKGTRVGDGRLAAWLGSCQLYAVSCNIRFILESGNIFNDKISCQICFY